MQLEHKSALFEKQKQILVYTSLNHEVINLDCILFDVFDCFVYCIDFINKGVLVNVVEWQKTEINVANSMLFYTASFFFYRIFQYIILFRLQNLICFFFLKPSNDNKSKSWDRLSLALSCTNIVIQTLICVHVNNLPLKSQFHIRCLQCSR